MHFDHLSLVQEQHDTSLPALGCSAFDIMVATDDEQQQQHQQGENGVSSTVLAPIQYSTLKQKQQSVIGYFQCQCEKPEFLEPFYSFRQKYSEPSFHANHHLLSPDSECRQRFENALLVLKDSDVLQVVFHGSPTNNISSILQNGLNPALRRDQEFGPGEYFSVDPSIAAEYCKCADGETVGVVVCVVILPETPAKEHVVIKNPNHHITIGVMQCVKVAGRFIINEKQRQLLARRFSNFHKRLQRCELPEQIGRVKRQILLDLQKKEPAMASDLYRRFSDLLKGTLESKEILDEVLARASAREFPEAVIAIQFPGLLESQMHEWH